jgi:hypothetical protein
VPHSSYWRKTNQTVADPQAERVLPWDLNDFYQNGGMAYGLRSVYGYDPLVLERYEAFIASRPDYGARTYDLLNARYLVTTAPLEPSDQPDAPRLLLDERNAYVYERPNALPRAWVAAQSEVLDDEAMLTRIHEADFDPRATALLESALACGAEPVESQVEFTRYEGNRVEARVQSGGGWLIFSEVYYPGWRATLDGQPAQLVRADYVLRALCVPEGEHQVVMVYDPPLLKLGLAVTGLTLLAIIVIAVGLTRRRGDER